MTYRIGIDIGGTFTDLVLIDDKGAFSIFKEDSTPTEPLRAISRGLMGLAKEAGLSPEDMLKSTDVLVHGQTRGTNALIERTGPRIGLLATEGFRDVIHLGNGGKPERFNIHLEKPEDFIPRYLRIGIPGRIGKGGTVHAPLDEGAVREAAAYLARHEVEAVAVAYLWSFANPAHERRTAEILAEELPGVGVFCSCDILPEIGEWERTSATVLSAYLSPIISDYLKAFETEMARQQLPHSPLIMQVNGGCTPVPNLLARPVNSIASGPAAGPAAGAYYAARTKKPDNLIIVDMGGTSFDICMLRNGEAVMSRAIKVADQPIGVNGVEVLSIGAGGGSIAWVDNGGALRVGPKSAGSEPGPACYGRGGTKPTVTDANLVAGRMSGKAFLGGRRGLDVELAKEAIRESVADALSMTVPEAAAGILTLVNHNMVSAIRSVSVERGIDPREYVMVAGGGAGGLHAADCARVLGIEQVLIPRLSGGLCAFGMSVTPVRHDYVRLHNDVTSSPALAGDLQKLFGELIEEGRADLRQDGFADEDMVFQRYLDGRYVGQVHNITIPLPEGDIDADLVAKLEADFHDEHETRFTYAMRSQPIEGLHWRVVATAGKPVAIKRKSSAVAGDARSTGQRDIYFPATNSIESADIYDWDELPGRAAFAGPAIVESSTTTIVVNSGDKVSVQEDGSLLLNIAID